MVDAFKSSTGVWFCVNDSFAGWLEKRYPQVWQIKYICKKFHAIIGVQINPTPDHSIAKKHESTP
jgi:hypothetical protein